MMYIKDLNLTCLMLSLLALCFATRLNAAAFISEIHYDNTGADSQEAIEISAETSIDLSGWTLVLYNGASGAPYSTTTLSGFASEAAGCGDGGGALVVYYSANGIQNGSEDAIALVDAAGNVIQFLSYEGTMTAIGGPADGITSTDIGVSESSSTPEGQSLQLVNGIWSAPSAHTYGICTTAVVNTDTPITSLSISEIHYDNEGADIGEAIELTGPVGASIDSWEILLYNGANGTVYDTISLTGTLASAEDCTDGYWVEEISGIQNGSPDGVALVNPDGEVTEFLSYEGVIIATDGAAAGLTSIDIGVAESSSTEVGFSLQREGAVWLEPATNTFGGCSSTNTPITTAFIHEIQGNGDSVTAEAIFSVEAVVTADFQDDMQLSGFFIQEEDADSDADPSTSEGIFVYCGACATDVIVGDLVRVTGLANEFFDMSQISATSAGDIEIIASGAALPTPASIDLPLSISSIQLDEATAEINAFYEAVEGMLVQFSDTLSVKEYFQLSRYGEVRLSEGGRPRQFTDAEYPSEAGYTAHQIDIATREVILDDDNNIQNAALFNNTPVFFPEGGFSTDNLFRGGDTIDALTGVLHWSWAGFTGTDAWRVRPVPQIFDYLFESQNPRSETPQAVGGTLKVASFNVLNYFTTLDEGSPVCGPDGLTDCRGANSTEELERQTQKIVSAICALDADIVGLMELQNPLLENSDDTPIATLVDAINTACPAYAAIDTGTVGGDAITVGLIYKPETVELRGETAILDDLSFTDPNATGEDKNRPAVAQTFEETATKQTLTVVVNHLKSKGSRSPCGEGDDDLSRGQGNCNLTRALASAYQAEWLYTYPTGIETDNILILGDLNAYRNEDPITAFANAGFVDVIDLFLGESAYGYLFDGQLGYLDYALASEHMLTYITGASNWNINADEVNLLDYNDTIEDAGEEDFEAKPTSLPLFSPDPYRSSDHDPLVVGIEFPKKDAKKCKRRHHGKHHRCKCRSQHCKKHQWTLFWNWLLSWFWEWKTP